MLITNSTPNAVKVLKVDHWSDRLFSFTVERPKSFRFRSGEFVMIGLLNSIGKPILRAYSITSPSWDEKVSFYSIKIKNGPLTSKLQKIKKGDFIIMERKSVGTLVLDALLPGNRIFLFSTGTGIAPFISLIRDPEIYDKFKNIILTNTCRDKKDLMYGINMVNEAKKDILVGNEVKKKLIFLNTTTRESTEYFGRITNKIIDKSLFKDIKQNFFDIKNDRVMICGSLNMNIDMKKILSNLGFEEGSNSKPGMYVVEKAFVEKDK